MYVEYKIYYFCGIFCDIGVLSISKIVMNTFRLALAKFVHGVIRLSIIIIINIIMLMLNLQKSANKISLLNDLYLCSW